MPRARAVRLLLALAVSVAAEFITSPAVRAGNHDEGPTGRITLDPAAVKRAGIRTTVATPAPAAVAVDAFGRVLDPLPLVEALHARAAARAAAAAARAEHERVTRLRRDDQNASQRDVESARAARERATVELASAEARAVLAWGDALSAGDTLVEDLVAGRAAVARIDLPAGVHVTPSPATATIAAVADPDRRRSARVLGRARTTDALVQGDAYLVVIDEEPPLPGASLVATLPTERVQAGVLVPAAAVVWSDARSVVYVETEPGVFERREVQLADGGTEAGRAATSAVEGRAAATATAGEHREAEPTATHVVSAGVTAGDHVVVSGAAELLSADVLRTGADEAPQGGSAAD